MSGSQIFLVSIGPIALLGALGFGFWLQRRDDAAHRVQATAGGETAEASDIDPELGGVLGYVKPEMPADARTKAGKPASRS